MPNRETIIGKISAISPRPVTQVTEEDKYFWDGDEEGAHFAVTKDIYPPPIRLTTISLSVSGDPSGAEKIKSDFRKVLGQELESETLVIGVPIEFVLWDAAALKQRQGN